MVNKWVKLGGVFWPGLGHSNMFLNLETGSVELRDDAPGGRRKVELKNIKGRKIFSSTKAAHKRRKGWNKKKKQEIVWKILMYDNPKLWKRAKRR